MIPKIVSSVPQNGAIDVNLDSTIQIKFSTNIFWSELRTSNFIVRNTTRNTGVTLDSSSPLVDRGLLTVTLTPVKTVDNHYFEGGCSYSVTIAGLLDASGLPVDETYTITFTAVGAEPVVEDLGGPDFNIVFTYPADSAVNVSPNVIRIRFNKELDKVSINYDQDTEDCVIKVTTNEQDPDTGDYTAIVGTIDEEEDARDTDITFRPDDDELIANTNYIVWIGEVTSVDADVFGPYNFTFKTKGTNTYTTIRELKVLAPKIAPLIDEVDAETMYEKIELVGKIFTDYCIQQEITYLQDDEITPNIYFIEYIKAYTIYELILNKVTDMNLGAQSKTLGDFEVSYRSNLSDLIKLLDIWLKKANAALEKLKGNMSGAIIGVAFRKGEGIDTAYEFMSRAMQVEDSTTKEW